MNFRVIDRATGNLVSPDSKSLLRLREIWESGKRKKKKEAPTDKAESETIKISEPILKRWEKDFARQYKLVEGQQPLTPQTGAGRARYSSPTLERIIAGEQFNPPQPLLRRKGETSEQALNRYLADIKHPLVRHRLVLFQKLLRRLVSRFGQPDMIVLEAVRSLALGKDKKREHIQKIHNNRVERESIRTELAKDGFSSSKNSILRYRLFKEAKGRCPFCLCPFCLQEVVYKEAEIEHIVPRSRVDCNEFYNLTAATTKKPSLATITASQRDAFRSDSPNACESRAARHYWKHLLPRLSEWQQTDERNRVPGTREGVNGMLDYGYAIIRTAVLRSLAAHGFIAAIGIAHTPKAGSFALADDLVEPFRPWIDRELRLFVQGGKRPMEEWMRQAVSVLQQEVPMGKTKVRLLNVIDLSVQSFANATLTRLPTQLKFPMLP